MADSERLERFLNEFLDGGLGVFVADGADAFVGFGLLVAEGDEGEDGVVDVLLFGSEALLGGGGFPGGGDADFVAELDDDALGGLFADALDAAERGDVAGDDESAELDGGAAVKDGEGELGADAADVVDEEEEEVALLGVAKP